jgi:hypothetical protein
MSVLRENALRVRVGIFILFSSPSLSYSLRRPSLSTDSTFDRLSLVASFSDSLYLAVLMFYLNIFFIGCVELVLYVLLTFFFIYFCICCVELCFLFFFFFFFFKLTGYELMI